MDIKNTSQELNNLGQNLVEIRTRLANQIPALVECNIDNYFLANATLVLSNLSRYAKYLTDISGQLDKMESNSSA